MRTTLVAIAAAIATSPLANAQQLTFTDATAAAGLGGITASRMCLADLNGDGRPDAVVRAIEPGKPDRYRVFINTAKVAEVGGAAPVPPFAFTELLTPTNLPAPLSGDCLVFADIDNDGHADAVFTRYLDINNEKFTAPPAPSRTCWMKGNGDGTFQSPQVIDEAQRATTACIAVGDIDRDGLLDLYLGNWYTKYGESNEAFTNDLLVQHRREERNAADWAKPGSRPFRRLSSWKDGVEFNTTDDPGGRPTYGALIASLMHVGDDVRPQVLELNYGRRANRLWNLGDRDISWHNPPDRDSPAYHQAYHATALYPVGRGAHGLDGDADRSGKYPEWLKERAKADPRFAREDEERYRSHGNTFDASINDIDNDGDFDLFLAEITHGWAGPSSDRSRFLLNTDGMFASNPRLSVDRVPADPSIRNWNQGDLFCHLDDFDHDGRVDLFLSSGDYPDNQRLRLYRQQDDGSFSDVTAWCGLNNEGSAQISVGDIDLDGDLDILVGQSFNRLDAAQIAGRTPTMKLYLNQTVERRGERVKNSLELKGIITNSLTLKLLGDHAKGCARDALGAIVRVTADTDGDPATPPTIQSRQLIGIGGHAGKQMEFLVHVGLGEATTADRVEVLWPDRHATVTVLDGVEAGRHEVRHDR